MSSKQHRKMPSIGRKYLPGSAVCKGDNRPKKRSPRLVTKLRKGPKNDRIKKGEKKKTASDRCWVLGVSHAYCRKSSRGRGKKATGVL